mgnify:CR=1 FL=1
MATIPARMPAMLILLKGLDELDEEVPVGDAVSEVGTNLVPVVAS